MTTTSDDIHQAFITLGRAIICRRRLNNSLVLDARAVKDGQSAR